MNRTILIGDFLLAGRGASDALAVRLLAAVFQSLYDRTELRFEDFKPFMDKPKIRPVEAFPLERNGQTFICLRDPTGLAPEPVLLGIGAYFIITLCDGNNDLRDIQAVFMKRFGELIPVDRLQGLISALDRAYFLDSQLFAQLRERLCEEFRASAERPSVHAGLCYSSDPEELRREIESFFAPPEGPGSPQPVSGPLAGLIAPHIDPRRGAAAYAHAYGELRAHQAPELVIILGTSHYPTGDELFSATRKHYGTPLGTVETDGDFVARLAARYQGGDLFAQELLHRNEHSIEFQALFLKWALGEHPFVIVPILVGSFHEMVMRGAAPAQDPRVSSFLEALGNELETDPRRSLVLAGVDFAHVGRKFGDDFTVDESVARHVEREDLELIEFIRRGDPAGFFAHVAKDGDARKICGLAPMYMQLELLRGRTGRLLKYGIAMESETGSAVSFASLAID